MEARKAAAEEIKRMLSDNDGKLCLGLVHYMYGPLRGLNVLIENPDIESILDALDSQQDSLLVEGTLTGISPDTMSKSTPKNIVELNYKVWTKVGLQSQCMILPIEIVDQAENVPTTYKSVDEAIKVLNQTLILTTGLQKEDPFFFRRGII
jgi:hypothetical protein